MRLLVYTPDHATVADFLPRAAALGYDLHPGDRLVLRNPRLFRSDELEPCDAVLVHPSYPHVAQAYAERGTPTHPLADAPDPPTPPHAPEPSPRQKPPTRPARKR